MSVALPGEKLRIASEASCYRPSPFFKGGCASVMQGSLPLVAMWGFKRYACVCLVALLSKRCFTQFIFFIYLVGSSTVLALPCFGRAGLEAGFLTREITHHFSVVMCVCVCENERKQASE